MQQLPARALEHVQDKGAVDADHRQQKYEEVTSLCVQVEALEYVLERCVLLLYVRRDFRDALKVPELAKSSQVSGGAARCLHQVECAWALLPALVVFLAH